MQEAFISPSCVHRPLVGQRLADTTLGIQKAPFWGQGESWLALLECLEARTIPVPLVSITAPWEPKWDRKGRDAGQRATSSRKPPGQAEAPWAGVHGQHCRDRRLTRTVL